MKADKSVAEMIHCAESCNEIEYEYAMHSYWNFRLRKRPGHPSPMHWCDRSDICATHSFGTLIGYDHAEKEWSRGLSEGPMQEMMKKMHAALIEKYPELEGKNLQGQCGMHQVATSVIEIAEDGLSARASFYTPGIMADNTTVRGYQSGCFMWERYGTDWVYDPDTADWGTFHNQVAEDFSADLDCENPAAVSYRDLMETGIIVNTMMSPMMPKGIDIPGPTHMAYSPVQAPQYNPLPPEPYDTLNHTEWYIPKPGNGANYIRVFEKEGVVLEDVLKKAFAGGPGPDVDGQDGPGGPEGAK